MSDIDRLKNKLAALEFSGVGSSVLMSDPELISALGVSRAVVFKASQAATIGDKAEVLSLEGLYGDKGVYQNLAIGADKDKTLTLAVAAWAADRLGAGKQLILIGDKRLGTESIEKFLATRLEMIEKFNLKDIGRVSLWRSAGEHEKLSSAEMWQRKAIFFSGVEVDLWSLPGVFARGDLDEGSAFLLTVLKPALKPGLRLLDLACGGGVVGAFALKCEPSLNVTLTDEDMNAVESAKKTFEENKLKGDLCFGDGISALPKKTKFDIVALNPPFHQGQNVTYHTGERLIAEASQVLADDGQMLMVANRFCPYERAMKANFKTIEIVFEDTRFRVWRCKKV